MRHIIVRVIPIVDMSYVFKEFFEIIGNEYYDFWRKAVFSTTSQTVVLNDCGVKIHFIQGDNNPVELIGIRPYWKFELNYPDHAAVRRLVNDVTKVCRDLIALYDSDAVEKYFKNDIMSTKEFIDSLYEPRSDKFKGGYHVYPEKVIFNKPATIIIWNDGRKTVVKCQKGDRYDPEKGLAMAYVKRLCGLKEFYKSMELGGK